MVIVVSQGERVVLCESRDICRLDTLRWTPVQKAESVDDYHAGKQIDMEWSAPDCHTSAAVPPSYVYGYSKGEDIYKHTRARAS